MLTHIYIKDFAIIREIDIDLLDQLNIITGETGTGKSVVIQAIDTALGGRGSSSLVATWADKATVQLVFDINKEQADMLETYITKPQDGQLIILREFNKNGKSIARINGEIVNLNTLRNVTSMLIDIHGQYDNQILMNPENHIILLDEYGRDEIFPIKEKLAKIYSEYSHVKKDLEKLRRDHNEFLRKIDFMKFEVDEINNAAPIIGEDMELAEKINILQNSEKISAALNETYDILYNNKLSVAAENLSSISQYNNHFKKLSESLRNCTYILEDICSEVRKSNEETTFNPEEIDMVMERLNLLENLKRKYGGSIEKILEYKEKCSAELEKFENTEEAEADLANHLHSLKQSLLAHCKKLSTTRRSIGLDLSDKMTGELRDLNFTNPNFTVFMSDRIDATGNLNPDENGSDNVSFLFNANKGGVLKPLAEIASGGEISRISLAFKHITNTSDKVQSMIFDEIDTGISGITASVVGNKLHQISRYNQILCITHLPQIAAAGDHQYLISKDDSSSHSYTTIKLLDEKSRIAELARLLGGTNVTAITLESARELIESSKKI